MKKVHWFELVIILLVLAAHIYVAASPVNSLMNWYRVDDAYYYFTTARNITNGLGSSLDGINPSNGYHPLWMLVCIPVFFFARFDIYLPFRILTIILGLLSAGASILLFRMVSRLVSTAAGIFSATVWAFTPLILLVTSRGGLEAGINAFFLILLISLVANSSLPDSKMTIRKSLLIGLVASLVFLSRLDNIFVIFMLGIWFSISHPATRQYLVWDLLVIFLSAYLGLLFRLGNFTDIYTFFPGVMLFIILGILVKIPLLYFFKLYQPSPKTGSFELAWRLVFSVSLAEVLVAVPVLLINRMRPGMLFPQSLPLFDWVISLLLFGLIRVIGSVFSPDIPPPITPLEFLKRNLPDWLRRAAGFFGVLLAIMAAYLVINQVLFAAPMPVSGQVKAWWGSMYTVYGQPADTYAASLGLQSGNWGLITLLVNSPFTFIPTSWSPYIYTTEFILLVLLIYFTKKRAFDLGNKMLLLPVMAGCFWQIWSYTLRSYVGYNDWYWIAELILSMLVLATLFQLFMELFSKPVLRKIITVVIFSLLTIPLLFQYTSTLNHLVNYRNTKVEEDDHLFGVSFLEDHTPMGAIIGMTGGGTTAYFIHDRTIVNLDGLINSAAYFKSLKENRAADFLSKEGLSYIFGRPYILTETDPFKDELTGHLQPVDHFASLVLFKFIP